MNLVELQKKFQRAWQGQDKNKSLVVFLSLSLCGLFVVFARVIAINSSPWISMSLTFAPLFIVGGLLFALGAFLIQLYQHPDKKYVQIVKESWKRLVAVCYITLPMLLVTLMAWLVLGFFFLLKEIPAVGEFLGVMLSFAPFVLILLSLTLVVAMVLLLFFLTPHLAYAEKLSFSLLKQMRQRIFDNPLISLLSFFVATLPLLVIGSLLITAALLTQKSYLTSMNPVLVGMRWFFLMLPFNALLTPVITFFFNFSSELYPAAAEQKSVI